MAVNGRYLTQPVTGVQRYAREIVDRLASASGWQIRLLIPPDRILVLEPGESAPAALDERWWGGKGHLWEQRTLPRLFRQSGADLLLSPAGWGPLLLRRQLVVVFDLHPLLHPAYFVKGFVWWTRLATPFLTHVPRRVAVISEHVQRQVVSSLRVDVSRIDIVPPAVGSPFLDWPLGDPTRADDRYCLFVGGDKEQKNLAFVLSFWPEVHQRLGLELIVTERSVGSRVSTTVVDPPGVRRVVDPSDDALAGLYADAMCLLWPSLAEGYGIPLLESMACGTPFLSSDVGAARDLAIEPGQVRSLDPTLWMEQLTDWKQHGTALLRRQGAAAARSATWERSADAMVVALRRSLEAV